MCVTLAEQVTATSVLSSSRVRVSRDGVILGWVTMALTSSWLSTKMADNGRRGHFNNVKGPHPAQPLPLLTLKK